MRRIDVWGNKSILFKTLKIPWDRLFGPWSLSQRVAPVFQESESCFQGQKRSDPTNREQESRLISIQRPMRWCRILLNCMKLKIVSYTSNLLEQMYDFQKCTMFLQKWILSPQDLLQNRSLETVPACIVLQYYPHNNIVCHLWSSGSSPAHHRPVFEAHPGANTFPSVCGLTTTFVKFHAEI